MKKLDLARLCSQPERACYHRKHKFGSLWILDCPVCDKEVWLYPPPQSLSNANDSVIKHLMRHTKQQLEAACLVQTMVLS